MNKQTGGKLSFIHDVEHNTTEYLNTDLSMQKFYFYIRQTNFLLPSHHNPVRYILYKMYESVIYSCI